jgi:hypothetical protein
MMLPLPSRRKKIRSPRSRRLPARNRPSFELLEARAAGPELPEPADGHPLRGGHQALPGAIHFRASAITASLTEQSSSGTPILGGTVTRLTVNGTATFDDLYVYGGTAADGTLIATSGSDLSTSAPFHLIDGCVTNAPTVVTNSVGFSR